MRSVSALLISIQGLMAGLKTAESPQTHTLECVRLSGCHKMVTPFFKYLCDFSCIKKEFNDYCCYKLEQKVFFSVIFV